MEIEHIIAVAAVSICVVFIFVCLPTSKPKDGVNTNQARNIPARKQHFSLPLSKAGLQQESENLSVAKRLGLSGDDGCVVTISLDILVRNLFEKISFCCKIFVSHQMTLTIIISLSLFSLSAHKVLWKWQQNIFNVSQHCKCFLSHEGGDRWGWK